jgi:hypothetical protein
MAGTAVLAPAEIRGRTSVQLVLPPDAVIDAETAYVALHATRASVG